MKNALDWVVGSGEFSGKPVAVLNTAERAHHAWDALKETISVMDADLIEEACLVISLTGNEMTVGHMRDDPTIATALREAISRLSVAAGSMPA